MDAEPAFREFVESASPSLLRAAWLLTLDWPDAQDLAQEALARTYARWDRIWREGTDPYPYARRILTNLRTDRWRRRRIRQDAEDRWGRQTSQPVSAPDIPAVEADHAHQMLSQLNTFQRRVLVLRYFEDISVEETAAALGRTPGAVKMAASRALQRLRSHNENEERS